MALGHLQLYTRRLTVEERRAIHTGCVFVWEERSSSIEATGDGIERWTDGRRWSCSKVKLDFLFYQEKLPDVNDEYIAAAMRPNQLVKQTYSVHVQTPVGRRKWHLVAYYTPETRDYLPSVDDIPLLASLRNSVPRSAYQPARTSRGRARVESDVVEASSSAMPKVPSNRSFYTSLPLPPQQSSPTPELAPASWDQDADSDDAHEVVSTPISPMSSTFEMPPLFQPPDPKWVLENCVAVFNIYEMPHRRVLDEASLELAPLVYMKDSPYQARHPFDVDTLRAFDTVSWTI